MNMIYDTTQFKIAYFIFFWYFRIKEFIMRYKTLSFKIREFLGNCDDKILFTIDAIRNKFARKDREDNWLKLSDLNLVLDEPIKQNWFDEVEFEKALEDKK